MRKFLFVLLAILLLVCVVSCTDTPDTTEGVSTTAPVTTDPTVTKAPIATTALVSTEPLPLRSFDEDEIYAHVFENHAKKVDWHEIDTDELDLDKKEMIVTFQLEYDSTISDYKHIDAYLVEDVSTEFYPTGTKYSCEFSQFMPLESWIGSASLVAHDYHEAYINIMFKHLTFTPCEATPRREDYVYYVGNIEVRETGKAYQIYSDGHLYTVEQNEDGSMNVQRSDQSVDAAYLFSIIVTSYHYKQIQNDWAKRYINETIVIPENCTTRVVKSGDSQTTYWVDENGTAYFQGNMPSVTVYFPIAGSDIGVMGCIHYHASIYEDAEKNGLFWE